MKYRRLGLAATGPVLVGSAAVFALGTSTGEQFCPAYGRLADSHPVRIGEQRFFTGLDADERNSGCFEPFGHYMVTVSADGQMTMEGYDIDGVVWDDCVVTWPDGSETSTRDAGISCQS